MTVVWRDFDANSLEREYAIEATVPNIGAYLGDYRRRSDLTRAMRKAKLDVAYGSGPVERLDIFMADGDVQNAPVVIFLHGGGWRASSKEDRSFPADFFCPRGVHFISAEYPLAPAAPLEEIIASARRAYDWVARNADTFGGDPRRIIISGNSAGGHLAAMIAVENWAERLGDADLAPLACVSVSGVFDMEPLRLTKANDWLQMDEDIAQRCSPINFIPFAAPKTKLVLAVGTKETSEFIRQSRDFHEAWRQAGRPGELMVMEGQNHFSIIAELAEPDSALAQAALNAAGIASRNAFDPDLPSNRMIFEVRRRANLWKGFAEKLEQMMELYGLAPAEREAWRKTDVRRLGELGVHPYFLPQVTRLMHGSGKNDSNSAAAQAYRRSMIEGRSDNG